MFKKIGNQLKKGKINGFIFFLILSSVFWFLTKFSKEYTATVPSTVVIENLPSNTVLSKKNDFSLSFDLNTTGFEFLFFQFKKPVIKVNIVDFYKKGNNVVSIPKQELSKMIATQLKSNLLVKNVSKDFLIVHLDEIISKSVKVLPKLDITYQDGFRPIESIKTSPDSITVSGPEEILNEIQFIHTEEFSKSNVNASISEVLNIEGSLNEEVIINTKTVQIDIQVSEFTQKKLSIPIELINVEEGLSLKIIPEYSEITFDISIENFNSISEKDFKLVCDYTKRNIEEHYFTLELVKSPNNITNTEIDVKKVNFLIFK